ncbi:hypothetical protein ACFSKJ_00320 [Tabrizicola soli]
MTAISPSNQTAPIDFTRCAASTITRCRYWSFDPEACRKVITPPFLARP